MYFQNWNRKHAQNPSSKLVAKIYMYKKPKSADRYDIMWRDDLA